MTVTIEDVREARERIESGAVVRRTEVDSSRSLTELTDARVFLKMEHLQRTGSFKPRGAYNKLRQVTERGDSPRIVAASAGNHAQGVALAADRTGLDATIVMPTDAPGTKVAATRGYGAEVELHGSSFGEAESYARDLCDRREGLFVPAYDDPEVVAGQGTIALEIYEQLPEVDTVVAPIGGGGLIGGLGAAFAGLDPDVRVVGVQATGAATVPQSLDKGFPEAIDDPDTIADGIATGSVSALTLELIREHVDEVVVVDDDQIATSILLLLERAKQLVEGAGATPVAGILGDDLDVRGETVVPVLSGGNIDMSMLQTVLTHAMADRNQLVRLRIRIEDRPGKMSEISTLLTDQGTNIRSVRHERGVADLAVGEAFLHFQIITSGTDHAHAVQEAIEAAGYEVEKLN